MHSGIPPNMSEADVRLGLGIMGAAGIGMIIFALSFGYIFYSNWRAEKEREKREKEEYVTYRMHQREIERFLEKFPQEELVDACHTEDVVRFLIRTKREFPYNLDDLKEFAYIDRNKDHTLDTVVPYKPVFNYPPYGLVNRTPIPTDPVNGEGAWQSPHIPKEHKERFQRLCSKVDYKNLPKCNAYTRIAY